MNLNEWAKEIHENAKNHGWWDDDRSFGDVIALYVEENGKPEGTAVEMADCLIRILDWFGREEINPEKIVGAKHHYNLGRPHRHGGKKL